MKRSHSKVQFFGIIAIIFGIGLIFDAVYRTFHFFLVIFALGLLFIGRNQRLHKKSISGNIILVIGALMLVGTIITSIAFQVVFVTFLIYFGYYLYKNSEKKVQVQTKETFHEQKDFLRVEPFFKNILVGEIRNIDEAYELDDINIQYGFGDVHIDLSNTIIPEGETAIVIRGMVGSVHLYAPYDVALSIHTSALFGKISCLDDNQSVFNKTLKFQTEDYKTATRKVKIITSILIGDIEVKNV